MKKYSDGEKAALVISSLMVGIVTFGVTFHLPYSFFIGLSYPFVTKVAIELMDWAWENALIDKKWNGISMGVGIFWPITLPFNLVLALGLAIVNRLFK